MKTNFYTLLLLITFSFTDLMLSAQFNNNFSETKDEKYYLAQDYIAKYKHFAIEEMQKTGIPASITLGQGILESDYGRSRLATLANNHFGAKAHNTWVGPTITHTDDAPDEHFRKYTTVEHSYRDHSKVLAKKRYAFLYNLNPFDYRAWAHGLKKAGYATDPKYAFKLIKIIEKYSLQIYDNPNFIEPTIVATPKPKVLQPNDVGYISASYTKPETVFTKKKNKQKVKKQKREKQHYNPIHTKEVVNLSFSANPQASVEIAMRENAGIKKVKPTWHNGNRALFFDYEVMPSQVAFLYELDLEDILAWNYTHANIPFKKQTPIYLETLRSKSGAMGNKTYKAKIKQTLVDIALASGINVERLAKLNKMENVLDYLKPGEIIQLKKKAKKAPKTIEKYHLEALAEVPNRFTLVEVPKRNFKLIENKERKVIEMPKDFFTKIEEDTPKIVYQQSTILNNYETVYTPINNYAKQLVASENFTKNTSSTMANNVAVFTTPVVENTVPTQAVISEREVYHKVEEGQTLYRLSVIYKVSVDSIKTLNNLVDNTIKTGSELRVK